jgi:hypothetical protein
MRFRSAAAERKRKYVYLWVRMRTGERNITKKDYCFAYFMRSENDLQREHGCTEKLL